MYRALLICNSTYPDDPTGLPELNGPRRDGLILWRALCDPLVGMFREEDIDVLYEGTSQEILTNAAALLESATVDDGVLLYFSGHAKRISKDDLILCGRNTRSHSSGALLSTGVLSTSLSKMIENSDAANVVIILDCCFSGSFKGADRERFDELKGDGRYILAASHPIELAEDSAKGLPSPFTRAVVQGLLSADSPDDQSDAIDLDTLFAFVEDHLPNDSPRPWRGFDGSGTFVISRKRTSGKQAPVAPDEKGSASARAIPVADSAVTLRRQSIDIRRFGRRLPGDISIADIRTWVVISIMGIATSGCLWLAYRRWPKQQVWRNDFQTSSFEADPRRLLVWPCIAISILVVLLAIAEGILFTRLDRRAKTRREVLSATHHRVISTLRSARHVISYMSAVAVLATLFGYQNYDIYWVMALSFLSIFTFTSAVESLRYGDALFFAGAALFICAAFLPVNPDYHSSAGILGSPAVEILLGVLMTAAWWFRASRGTIILSVIICVLPLVTVLTGGSEAVLAPYVGLVGVGVAALAWVLGAGQRIGRGDEGSLVSAPAVQN